VARALARAGHDVVGLHRRDTRHLTAIAGEARLALRRADLKDVAAVPGPFAVVVHVAATSPAPGVDALQLVGDNLGGTAAVVAAALRWQCRAFVFFSTVSLYGEVTVPVLDETSPSCHPDAYGMTKLLGERMLAEQAAGLPSLALRLPGLVGPGAQRNWLTRVADSLGRGEPVPAANLDAPFNNAVHVEDLSAFVVNALARDWSGADAVVLGARGTLPIRAVIERLARAMGRTPRIEPVPSTRAAFTLSSAHAMARWGYDPPEIGALLDRYGREVAAWQA
jgi:UDP-glucose 4-epimerase